MKKLPQVRLGKSAAVLLIAVKNDASPMYLIKRDTGMKYMLAMLCSNPAATKQAMGGMIAMILSVTVRAL